MYAKILTTAVLLGAANAHFFISQPPPIPGSADKAPLDPSGSNFPCQGADLTGGTVTNMAAGSSQPLQFGLGDGANWAVHGGGSCQISITYETDKAKQKDPNNWKVIHSYVGGCPTDTLLNLDKTGAIACNGANSPDCVKQDLTFQIPSEVKDGSAILAWTWFNNVGNREMYMNCAKVSISGGSNQVSTLPSLFTANIGNGCSTTAYFNTDFPNPGKYITKNTLNYPLKAPQGSCASGPGSGTAASSDPPSSSGSGTSGTGSGTGSTTTPAASAPSPATSGTKGGKGGKGGQGGAFAEGASSPTTLATVPQAAPTAASAPAPAAAAPAAGSGSCSNGAVACTATGFYCIDQSSFGLCDRGCAIPMKMAAGTMCSGGAVARIVNRHIHHRRHFMGVSL